MHAALRDDVEVVADLALLDYNRASGDLVGLHCIDEQSLQLVRKRIIGNNLPGGAFV